MLWPPVVEEFGERIKEELRNAGKIVFFKRGTKVWQAGHRVDRVFLIRVGLLSFELESENGLLGLGMLKAGDFLIAGLDGDDVAPVSAKALTAVTAFEVPSRFIGKLMQQAPSMASVLVKHLLERQMAGRYLAAMLMNAPLEKRLAYSLWVISARDRHGRRVLNEKVGQSDLASFIGSSREEVSRKQALLEKSGYLHKDEDGATVLSDDIPMLFLSEADAPSFILKELGLSE